MKVFTSYSFFFRANEDKVHHSHMVDLLDVNLGETAAPVDPWGMPQPPRSQVFIKKKKKIFSRY